MLADASDCSFFLTDHAWIDAPIHLSNFDDLIFHSFSLKFLKAAESCVWRDPCDTARVGFEGPGLRHQVSGTCRKHDRAFMASDTRLFCAACPQLVLCTQHSLLPSQLAQVLSRCRPVQGCRPAAI